MLKLSKLADYAVVIIEALSRQEQEAVPASVLAKETYLPEPTVAKIMKLLTTAEIVISTRGVKGGYILTMPLTDISVKRVVTAIDGPIALTACTEVSVECCGFASKCSMHGRWDLVNKAIKDILEDISLAEMISYSRV